MATVLDNTDSRLYFLKILTLYEIMKKLLMWYLLNHSLKIKNKKHLGS